MLIAQAAIVILLVDFVSGLVHWAEDTFWTETTPVVGRWIVEPNVLHHNDGSAFTQNNWLQSSWDLLVVGALILGLAWLLDQLLWREEQPLLRDHPGLEPLLRSRGILGGS